MSQKTHREGKLPSPAIQYMVTRSTCCTRYATLAVSKFMTAWA